MKKTAIMLLVLIVIGTFAVINSYAGCRNQGSTCPNDCTGTCPNDCTGICTADVQSDTDEVSGTINITIAPKTLVLGLQGEWVTVHTDIAYSSVDGSSVELDGIVASSVFPDNRGNLVAKFTQEAVEAIVTPPQATLTLTGSYKTNESFTGSDTIAVKN
ncbi:MAG: hypothetical protein JXB48_13070 [Candidatus Latescibacteria bacterium]|nr:hypothetical protein [Candidatus Latescibacterota bacterium]